MEKQELKELLKTYLTIDVKETEDMYQKDLEITISFDGEEICTSTHNIERKGF